MDQQQSVVSVNGPNQAVNSTNLPKLNRINYQSWRELIDMVLELRGLKRVTERSDVDSKVNLRAKLIFLETLDESHMAQVRGCESAKDIIDRLQLIYAHTSAANVYRPPIRYYRYEKKREDPLSEHIGRMDEMRNQLADLGEKQSEAVYQVTLIESLPSEYSSIMEVWELTHKEMRTTQNLVSRLLERDEDSRRMRSMNKFSTQSSGKKLSREQLKKITKCNNSGQTGHWFREFPTCNQPKGELAMKTR